MRSLASREYERDQSIVFRKTAEPFGGLSNMAPGFPLEINGVRIRTSEALYQACRFPHLPDVQQMIIRETSPMAAKMKSKPFRDDSRSDWAAVRTKIMRWCLHVKLAQNWDSFGLLLLSTGDRTIVEESAKDDFWGAHPQGDGKLLGANVLGRLLMELRQRLRVPEADMLRSVAPLSITDFLLYGEPIRHTVPTDVIPVCLSPSDQTAVGSSVRIPRQTDLLSVGHLAVNSITDPAMVLGQQAPSYAKRLIEVDLPIKRISTHARREKSIRHGHISTLHIWWARRPLAACRAVLCATLWPDPADPLCPRAFLDAAKHAMRQWTTHERQRLLSQETRTQFESARKDPRLFDDVCQLRQALLGFIADFANWDNASNPSYLDTARGLTLASHETLGGTAGSRPVVADPFAGGGSIPLEALRVGADAFASDLNPLPIILNKVMLEFVPKHGQRLVDEVKRWSAWVREQAAKRLEVFYPTDPDGAVPVAYLWARTIHCEGPSCGAELPLIRSLAIARRGTKLVAVQLHPNHIDKTVDIEVIQEAKPSAVGLGVVRRGSATCPCCGYTTEAARVRSQFKGRAGGAADARLFAVVLSHPSRPGRTYRAPTERDVRIAREAAAALAAYSRTPAGASAIPFEALPYLRSIFNINLLDVELWKDLFSPRQLLALSCFNSLVPSARAQMDLEPDLADAVATCLALIVGRQADKLSSLARWDVSRENSQGTFGRQALPIVWDFNEVNPFSGSGGDWDTATDWVTLVLHKDVASLGSVGHVEAASATDHPLPNDSVSVFATDPPYYDAVPYADLSDFFYVWLKRSVGTIYPRLFEQELSPKRLEVVQLAERNAMYAFKTKEHFEDLMRRSLAEGRRITRPGGLGVIVFAHKTTDAWEVMLQAVVDAGWIIVASWPIDTEMGSRLRAMNSATLASSIHLICRPRETNENGALNDDVGDWRTVLAELPLCIHEWMPRMASEGVVGADAIFACLGPALQIFSRYSRVERANGDPVALREYLEHVWAAVSREALSMIFADPETSGLDEDARVTAMWLWTLAAPSTRPVDANGDGEEMGQDDEDEDPTRLPTALFTLEFDAARKIAQGLGASLETLQHVIQVKGAKARLLRAAERTKYLFGGADVPPVSRRAPRKEAQRVLFEELNEVAEQQGWGEVGTPRIGSTTLDRVHQSMILFGAGRGEALKRFLVEEGVGTGAQFWKLAQALSALYPPGTDEKRWVDGVLARKKGLGF